MLLLITDGLGEDLPERVEIACAVLDGVDFAVQLRAKRACGADLFRTAARIVKILDDHAPLFVNDRLDVARAAGAQGVHLPSTGLPLAVARQLWPTARLGRSTHTLDEIAFAREGGADYIVYGPIAPTPGKRAIGWDTLPEAVKLAGSTPLYAVGGLGASDVPALRLLGAHLAVIRAGLGGDLDGVEANLTALAKSYSMRDSVSV